MQRSNTHTLMPANPPQAEVCSRQASGEAGTGNEDLPQSHPERAETGQAPVRPTPVPQISDATHMWASEINEALGKSIGMKFRVGQLLIEAKLALGYGQWVLLFEGCMVGFGLRIAEMYMAIARCPTLGKSQHLANLPTALTTLYELSKLCPEAIERKIASGLINSETKAADARRLVQTQADGPAALKSPHATFDPDRAQAHLLRYLRAQAERWPVPHHQQLAGILESAARELRAKNNKL